MRNLEEAEAADDEEDEVECEEEVGEACGPVRCCCWLLRFCTRFEAFSLREVGIAFGAVVSAAAAADAAVDVVGDLRR